MTRGHKIALGFFVASILSFITALFADSGRLAAAALGGICLGLAVANLKRGRDARNSPPGV
jgi:hypothetical protein